MTSHPITSNNIVMESTLACGLQESIGKLWKGDDLKDFTVVVESTSFQCHRFILWACSDFFQGLFRSGMKECQENHVNICGMTASTFDIILYSLYTGISRLTEDNVLDVWSATVLLQIGYLAVKCENFVIEKMSVDSCFIVLKHATMYSAKKVVDCTLDFIAKHFEQVRSTEYLLQMPYDYFYKVVGSDYLIANSEDVVLEAVLKWVQYMPRMKRNSQTNDGNTNSDANTKDLKTSDSMSRRQVFARNAENNFNSSNNKLNDAPTLQVKSNSINDKSKNNSTEDTQIINLRNKGSQITRSEDESTVTCATERREQNLYQLISACKLYLITSSCLETILMNNELVLRYGNTHRLLFEALVYVQHVERRHDTWPELAVHRLSSSMKHGMVFMLDKKCMFYDLKDDSIQAFADLPDNCRRLSTVTYFNNKLFLYYSDGIEKNLSVYSDRESWVCVNSARYTISLLLAHGDFLYGLRQNNLICKNIKLEEIGLWYSCCNLKSSSDALVRFAQYVLAFYTNNDSVTAQCFNTKTKKMHVSETAMDGTSKDMTSFSHQEDVFILQRNGTLWKIVSSDKEPVDFELITKLWNKNYNLRGCVVYRKQLFVFYLEEQQLVGDSDTETDSVTENVSKTDIFTNLKKLRIKMVAVKTDTPCLPMVLPESWCSGYGD